MPNLKSATGNSKFISLDDVCVLKTSSNSTIASKTKNETEYMCFCSRLSITRQEFLNAGQLGLKPQFVLVVNTDEYDDQTTLIYEEKRYSVYKTYQRADGFTELYCERKSGV